MDTRNKVVPPEFGTPDEDTPELTPERRAKLRPFSEIRTERGLKPLGRPRAETVKLPVNLRLDPEIVAHFRAGGDGWQTRINAVLSRHVRAAKGRAQSRSRSNADAAG